LHSGEEKALLFCEQKRSKKNFDELGEVVSWSGADKQKFFAAVADELLFFEKVSACLTCLVAASNIAMPLPA
jgi:hypothetical protein